MGIHTFYYSSNPANMAVYVVGVIIVVAIGAAVRGVRSSRRRAQVEGFHEHVASSGTPLALEPGETVAARALARAMTGYRVEADGERTSDRYPQSFPVVAVTNRRVVIAMSTSNDPTAMRTPVTPRTITASRRIGEHFGDVPGVSALGIPFDEISTADARGGVTIEWSSGAESGSITLEIADAAAAAAVLAAIVAGTARDPGAPSAVCRSCGADTFGDRFCSSCGTATAIGDGVAR